MLAAALLGCAPATGWERARTRTCEPEGPARVCLRAEPDRPLTLTIGGARIVPGECVEAPRGGGAARAVIEDGRTQGREARWIRARRGHVQAVEVDGGGRARVRERRRCDRTPG